jgi:hypothetical protein
LSLAKQIKSHADYKCEGEKEMKKKLLLITGLLVLATTAFAQDADLKKERVTYYDLETKSTKTVNAVFIGWKKSYTRKDGNYAEKFSSFKWNISNADWDAYEKSGTIYYPLSLRELYNYFVGEYQSGKHIGTLMSVPNGNGEATALFVDTILPGSGNSSPYWWSLDERLMYTSEKVYLVK